MKKLLPKTAAILGMLLTLVCAFYLIKAGVYSAFPEALDDASGEIAWGSGLFALLVSVFSLLFYGIDAFLCVTQALDGKDRVFNIILASLFGISLLLGIWAIATVLRHYKAISLYIAYFSLFVLEIISVVRLFTKRERAQSE